MISEWKIKCSKCQHSRAFSTDLPMAKGFELAKEQGWIHQDDGSWQCWLHTNSLEPVAVEPANPFLSTEPMAFVQFVCSWCFASSPPAMHKEKAAELAIYAGWKMIGDDPQCKACVIKQEQGVCELCTLYGGDAEDNLLRSLINHHPSCQLLARVPIQKDVLRDRFNILAQEYCQRHGWMDRDQVEEMITEQHRLRSELQEALMRAGALADGITKMQQEIDQLSGTNQAQEIQRLGSFIIRLNAGVPKIDEAHPQGMSAVDAAIYLIQELRGKEQELLADRLRLQSNLLRASEQIQTQELSLRIFEKYIHTNCCSDEDGWFAFFTPTGSIFELPEWRVNGCESEDQAVAVLSAIATAALNYMHQKHPEILALGTDEILAAVSQSEQKRQAAVDSIKDDLMAEINGSTVDQGAEQ